MINQYEGEDFDDYQDHESYFLKEDALHSLGFDVYFSPTKKYYCNANCTVCYIKEDLKKGLPYYVDAMPDSITDEDEERWHSVFKYFYSVRTNDDLTYLKLNYPKIFEWYKNNNILLYNINIGCAAIDYNNEHVLEWYINEYYDIEYIENIDMVNYLIHNGPVDLLDFIVDTVNTLSNTNNGMKDYSNVFYEKTKFISDYKELNFTQDELLKRLDNNIIRF